MKRLLPLILCLTLLFGCAPAPDAETIPTETTLPAVTEPAGLYDPDSAMEAATKGALRCYPLKDMEATAILALDDTVILFSCTANTTRLTALTGDTLVPGAQLELNLGLFPEDACLNRWERGFSFYDPVTKETVVLDSGLREVSRIPAPEGLVEMPILSYDRSTLYYFTDSALRALDLETGISRVLKEMAYDYQTITRLLLEDTVIACTISDGNTWQKQYLSTETGAILTQTENMAPVWTSENRYFATAKDGSVTSLVLGSAESEPRLLQLKEEYANNYFLPDSYGLVSLSIPENAHLNLDYYDLDACLRTSSLVLNTEYYPWSFQDAPGGKIWFLNYEPSYGCTVLYLWAPALSPTEDLTYYGGAYFTREEPDIEGLEACKVYAEQIGEKYGIEVLIYKEAVKFQPWDYDLEPEHLSGVIQRELELLDRNLSRYPLGFVRTLAQRFDGVSICIVRSLTGTAESGSLDSADGIQFMDGYRACIALAAASNTEYALYHEMCHLIDTLVISESGAYDRWDELNPKGFDYDYDYIANQSRDGSAYLQEINRSFIDTYSMSFPKEDRARIMEYAMTAGNEDYFRSTTMQAKLKLLCEGIREAFNLKKSPETFLWEQYLNTSLAYKG